jgi:hypothetical protein
MKLKQILSQYFGFSGHGWGGEKITYPKLALIISLLFGMQFSYGQFEGWDVTGSNPRCYSCMAYQELTEDAVASLDCGRIQSTAEVSISFECKTLGVEAAGIRLTDGLRARAGCETSFRALPLPPGGVANEPDTTTEVVDIDIYEDVTISADDLINQEQYNWYDSEGNLVHQGQDFHIIEAIAEKYTLKVIDIKGFETFREYDLKYKPNRLETLYPNPSTGGNLNIQYKINEANSAYIMIFSYYMNAGTSYNYIVDMSVAEKNIDISNLPFGLYKVALITDGQIVDVKILSKL